MVAKVSRNTTPQYQVTARWHTKNSLATKISSDAVFSAVSLTFGIMFWRWSLSTQKDSAGMRLNQHARFDLKAPKIKRKLLGKKCVAGRSVSEAGRTTVHHLERVTILGENGYFFSSKGKATCEQ